MATNYERLAVQEDDTNVLASATSLLPLHIEEEDFKRSGVLLSRLQALGRIPQLTLYFLVLAVGVVSMTFILIPFLDIKTPESRGTITMDDVFDGSLSPRKRMIEWLPQCEFCPHNSGVRISCSQGAMMRTERSREGASCSFAYPPIHPKSWSRNTAWLM